MKQKSRAVVTGGAGFIGSHLAEKLLELGYEVIIVDDLSTGNLSNIAHLRGENITFFEGSIVDYWFLKKLFINIDYVFHQAAITSVPYSVKNPFACHEVNVTGTLNVLRAARDNRVKKVICASSCAVYGDDPAIPKKEQMLPAPQSPYAASKLSAEHYCEVFNQLYGVQTVCLRYFNVYGPRQNPFSEYSAVIPKFMQRISSKSPPIIFGDGEQTRDFIYVRDVAMANLLASQSDITGIFNVGSGESVSLNALARYITFLSNTPNLTPIFMKARSGDIRHSLADITKARSFGFRPEFSLEHGLLDTLRSFSDSRAKQIEKKEAGKEKSRIWLKKR